MTMKYILIFACFTIFALGGSVSAKTINVPAITVEVAVQKAQRYVADKGIDVSNAFVGVVEYHNLHNEYERPYWRVRWLQIAGGKGGWFELRLFSDGSVQELYGK